MAKKIKTTKKDLLEVIPNDVFAVTKQGYVLLGVNPITKEEVKALQEEIKFLEKTRIWSIMTASVTDLAKEKMFEKAESFVDMTFGKAMLKNVELMRQIMSNIKSIKIPEPKPIQKKQPVV